uniref:Putative secreted protein n=1 Tax=Anopheles darlingi TaxID=43151 RepID=A0A2M4D2D8_ANODA
MSSQCYFVLLTFTAYLECTVAGVPVVATKVLHFHYQLMGSSRCELVNFFQPQPKFFIQASKTISVLCPISVKINCAIEPMLHNDPSSSKVCLLAKHIKSFTFG